MAFEFGTFSQWDDSVTIGDPTIATAASVIKPVRHKGALFQALGGAEAQIDVQTYEIYNRSKNARTGTVATGGWDDTATTALPISTDLAKGITVGQVLKIESELVVVSAVTSRSASATISVWARGAGGTTAAAHTATTVITSAGYAGQDLDLKNVESVFESTAVYTNYMQTIFETVDWQKRGEVLRKKGLAADQVEVMLMEEAMLRYAEQLAVMTIEGEKQIGSEGASPYMCAGIPSQLLDNASGGRPILTSAVGGAFTEAALKGALQTVTQTGNPTAIWMSVANKAVFNGFNDARTALDVVTDRTDKTAGGSINHYEYENSIYDAKIDADLGDDVILILNEDKTWKAWQASDGLARMVEPQASSREYRESLQGSIGLGVDDVGYEHIIMTGLTT